MKTLSLLAATAIAVLSLAGCGLSPAASAANRGSSYSSGDDSGGTPFLGHN
jgi:hypothetical protein